MELKYENGFVAGGNIGALSVQVFESEEMLALLVLGVVFRRVSMHVMSKYHKFQQYITE